MSQEGTREDLIRYRLEMADQAFKDAQLLASYQSWNAVVNRLYYACLYATMALLARHQLTHGTHNGVKHQFNLHFIRKGIVSPSSGKFYNKLSQQRNMGDYNDFMEFSEPDIQEMLTQARSFLDELKGIIST